MDKTRTAKFMIGQVVRHRVFAFRGVIYDVDPVFANTEEWWLAIPAEVRPSKDQPFYHLLAENDQSTYVAYVSEQNLVADESGEPIGHPNWIHELKHDRFRGILYIDPEQACLVSRKGKKFRQFDPLLKQVLRSLKGKCAESCRKASVG